jgi:hypothetical protein
MKTNPIGGVMNAHVAIDNLMYRTEHGDPLAGADVTRLNAGDEALCMIGAVTWRDDSGHYETYFSECLVAETPRPQGGFNWHIGPETNAERKLEN